MPTLFASWLWNDLWYALPLIVAISLVYAATRHEAASLILRHAARVGLWIAGFMAVVIVLLQWITVPL